MYELASRLNLSKPLDSRTFINLIHRRSSRFFNWEPSFPIELGDFGTVRRDSGEFVRIGNIHSDPRTADVPGLCVREGVQDHMYNIITLDVYEVENKAGPIFDIPGVAEATFKAQFKFGRTQGAALLMYKPTTFKLEGYDNLIHYGQHHHLRNMCLVTEVVKCSAYLMYLSGKKSEVVGVALCASAPIAQAVGVTAGGEIDFNWHHEGIAGVVRCGAQLDQSFVTLYRTVTIGKKGIKRRELETPDPETLDKDCWMDSALPWNTLNENGEEEDEEEQEDDDDW